MKEISPIYDHYLCIDSLVPVVGLCQICCHQGRLTESITEVKGEHLTVSPSIAGFSHADTCV